MARRVALPLLAIFLITTQLGCWDRLKVEELGIVLGQGIEPAAGDKIRIILQVVNPVAQANGMTTKGLPYNKPYTNLVAEGDTLFEAIRKMSKLTGKRNIATFIQVVIVSEDLAREKGIRDLLDLVDRDPEYRRSLWLLIGRGDLAGLLDEPGQLNTIPSERIREIIERGHQASVYAPQRLGEFYKLMESESSQPFTAVVETEPNLAVPWEKGHGLSDSDVPEPLRQIKLNGTAVFNQDKMVGWLNDKESRGLLWLRGEIREGYLKFPSPGGTGKLFTTEILHSKTTLQPEIRGGDMHMTVKIKAETYLEESREPIDVETIKRLEAAQAVTIEEEARAALDKAQQEYRSDVFGFGEAVHRKYPREWKEMKNNWPEKFSNIQVSFLVETKIRHTAMIASPAESK
ncbi:MAG: Ger(x)C family spore germination protein [Desulfotomaculaceae bacterium]|nr:Ger(x)C family spore germination protein [Desulfotomaculaceae bacterium]